jgi:hypothetical protein
VVDDFDKLTICHWCGQGVWIEVVLGIAVQHHLLPLADGPQVEPVLKHPEGRILEGFIGRSDNNRCGRLKRWGAE